MQFTKDETRHQELTAKGEELEVLLQSAEHSEQEKQLALMDYLSLLNTERAADLGVSFTSRMLERISSAMEAHPTADVAVDQLYTCLLLQQFHVMQFDAWRAHPAIEKCSNALTLLEAEGRLSDCLRFCQEAVDTYTEASFWPEALAHARRAHGFVRELIKQDIKVLENGELLDLQDSAFFVLKCAMNTAEGITAEMEAELQADLGAEQYAATLADVTEVHESEPAFDPVEMTPEYLAIRYELEEKIDEALEHERGYYDFCKEYWVAKRMILRGDYGIQWKSPAALNPSDEY